MTGIHIITNGDVERAGKAQTDGNHSDLLYQRNDTEVVMDYMPKGTVGIFFSPEEGSEEMCYVLQGKIVIHDLDETIILEVGDFYTLQQFDHYVMFEVLENSKELYICTHPRFDENEQIVSYLMDMLQQLQDTDGDTMHHCERVKTLSMFIAHEIRFDPKQLRALFYASRFHDVGKSKIPLSVLLKPGRLTDEEYKIMKEHSRYTYEIILEHFGSEIANIAYEHHEHLNGKGYPRGLSGSEISLAARIISVADAYDAMITDRPYHVGKSIADALAELHRCENTQFDPEVIAGLESYLQSRE